jgi:hypothetical protein
MPADIWPLEEPIKLDLGEHAAEKDAIHNLSGGAFIGEHLYLANDEGTRLLRLQRTKPSRYASCEAIDFKDIFDLPGKKTNDKEFDLEALAVDTLDKKIVRLWMIGSHAMGHDEPPNSELKRLGLKRQRNRLLFGCVQLDAQGGIIEHSGRHLRITGGKETHTTEFLSAVRAAPPQATGFVHEIEALTGQPISETVARNIGWFAPYTLASTKENGLDIEGLAIRRRRKDPSKVVALVGMRGPVIDGFAVIVEVEVRDQDARELAIEGKPHFHLLNLKGFGVRDLEWRGDDLLILAGPTMTRQKESALFCWRGAWGATGARGDVRNVSEVGTVERIARLPMPTDDGPEVITAIAPGSDDHMLLRDGDNKGRIDGSVYKAEVYRLEES